MGLEAAELARWTRFAAKGGIGKCTALCDCVAESPDDLMFLKDDEITVLYQLPDREGFYLGYCEGVVGRFNGADVHFRSKLKKPVMTKRASVSASTTSGKSPTSTPTPTSGIKSPSPVAQRPRRSSSSQRETNTLERRGSGPSRVVSPLSSQVQSSDEESRHPPHMSHSSVSTVPDSVLNTPAHGFFPPSIVQEAQKHGIYGYGTPSPREATFPAESSRPGSIPPTRVSTPPSVSVTHSETNTNPLSHRYTAHAPSPLNLFPESNTTPLRITKRSPVFPPAASPYHSQPLSPPAPIPSADIPDTSYSTLEERAKRLSDARVGIGLSLLQSLADGMDSDSEEEEEDREDRWPQSMEDDTEVDAYAAALSRVGRRDSLDESTVEGLGYARSEEEHGPVPSTTQLPPQGDAPPPQSFFSSELEEFPKPPTSLPSPATSPISQTFSHQSSNIDERERRPSLAPSSGSAGSWEGASDIYDDYRYSRISIASRMSRFSGAAGSGMSTPPAPTPPIPESRPSFDSFAFGSRQRADSNFSNAESVRSRTDSNKSRAVGLESPRMLPQVAELPGDQEQQMVSHPKRTTIGKDRSMSIDSQVSVYSNTHNSRLFSQDVGSLLSLQANPSTGLRPAPLNFTHEPSPLLHTTWGSPVSSAGSPPPSAAFFTSIPSIVNQPAANVVQSPMLSPTFGGFASAMRQRLEEDRKSPNPEQEKKAELEEDRSRTSGEGLGNRIVIEDQDELPSRILDSFTSDLHDSPSSSPEPDFILGRHLAPLAVANRTPSPSILEGGSDDGRLLEGRSSRGVEGDRSEVEDEQIAGDVDGDAEEQPTAGAPPSPMVPTRPPSTPPNSSPTPGISPSPSPSRRRRPSLAELREGGGPPVPGTNQRRSLFLPHPNAPKAPVGASTPGPMYIAAQQPQPQLAQFQFPLPQGQPTLQPGPGQLYPQQQQRRPPPRPNVLGVIRMALSMPPRPQTGPNGMRMNLPPRGPTIYGRTESDLSAAIAPVPIIFSVDPPPAPPANTTTGNPLPQNPRVQMMAKQQQPPARSMSMGTGPSDGSSADKGGSGIGSAAGAGSGMGAGGDSRDGQSKVAEAQNASGGVIPRANFFPKAAGLRPRSRSFSGFNSTTAEVPLPERSREDSELSARDTKRSLTTSSSSLLTPNSTNSTSTKPTLGSSPLRPSPLSLSVTALKPSATSPVLKSPSSPLAQAVTVPLSTSPTPTNPPSPAAGSLNSRPPHQLRQAVSRSTLNETTTSRPVPLSRSTLPASSSSCDTAPTTSALAPGRTASLQVAPQTDASSPLTKVVDPDAASIHSVRSQLVSPPPLVRQTSLRSKLSLPNLRRKQRLDEETSIHSPSNAYDSELLQVQDMEFELVRPNLAHFQQAARTSEDSNVLGRDHSLDLRQDSNSFLRPESPAVSVSSGGGRLSSLRSPSATTAESGNWIPQTPTSSSNPNPSSGSRGTTDAESSMDAHRQRELKWMSLMSASPASQARKSKKVKKLVMDGVPSSVRYLVWSYLTDGKARCVPGVYAQLCSRGRVPSSSDMERDIKVCFQDQPHLQGQQGPVGVLLQAYLNMVPDVQYSMGLTLIVGQLLLLSPEEDAFWIFISIMDTHIRPYFSSTTTQMEVDSALFSRALETNDPSLARKLLVDMGMTPSAICQPWFSRLFVSTLPLEYLNRVWDLFLFEGVPFLLRVGLALLTCCRRKLLDATSDDFVLTLLLHPPQAWLPSTPDAFLSLAFSLKMKDDDVRRQRVKMEAQVKRQTQAQIPRTASMTAGGMISLPRT